MSESGNIKPVWKLEDVNVIHPEIVPTISFADIMAEQIQEAVHDEDSLTYKEELLRNSEVFESSISSQDCTKDYELACILSDDPDCSADLQLAEKLQRQFDREAELREKFQHSKETYGVAKAILSSDPYHYMQKEDGSSNEEDDDTVHELYTDLLHENHSFEFPPCGFIRTSDGFVTKHDRLINERKNYNKAMQLDLSIESITGERLTEKVLNNLRTCSKIENRKHIRVNDKDEKATNASSMDAQARLVLLKWINSGQFDHIEGVIAMGKEAVVLHAVSDFASSNFQSSSGSNDINSSTDLRGGSVKDNKTGDTEEEDKCSEQSGKCARHFKLLNERTNDSIGSFAVKIFKTSLSSFRNRSEYVKEDFRFKNPRNVMKIWAEKEFMNLQRLRKTNVMCPTPIRLYKNVLLMSLIGKDKAAKKLKDVEFLDFSSKSDAFEQVKKIIDQMFKKSGLVHGDLSEFNLLWHEDVIYVIDVAQAMDTSHPRALAFLLRDIINILEFFKRIGTEDLPTARELFMEVTQISINPDKNLLSEVESFERENRNSTLRRDKSRPADMELRLYYAESTDRSVSPARPFN